MLAQGVWRLLHDISFLAISESNSEIATTSISTNNAGSINSFTTTIVAAGFIYFGELLKARRKELKMG